MQRMFKIGVDHQRIGGMHILRGVVLDKIVGKFPDSRPGLLEKCSLFRTIPGALHIQAPAVQQHIMRVHLNHGIRRFNSGSAAVVVGIAGHSLLFAVFRAACHAAVLTLFAVPHDAVCRRRSGGQRQIVAVARLCAACREGEGEGHPAAIGSQRRRRYRHAVDLLPLFIRTLIQRGSHIAGSAALFARHDPHRRHDVAARHPGWQHLPDRCALAERRDRLSPGARRRGRRYSCP